MKTDFISDKEELVPALEVEALSKTYRGSRDGKPALSDVSFSVQQGEIFGLLGPNGAGKSTLIGVLAGLVTPNAGSIRVLGMDLKRQWRAAKMAVGIVPQEICVDPFFTVEEALRLQGGYFGLRHNRAWREEVVERLGLTDKLKSHVTALSGGMKRRVLIAQALMHRPPIIVLDEPTAGVDIELRRHLWEFMTELNRLGHTIILTTHYLEEAEKLCGRVALLSHGRLAALDDTRTLLHRFSGDRIKFRTAHPLPADFPVAAEALGGGAYSVPLASPETLRTLLNALAAAGIPADSIELGKANLEEVFVRLTQA